MQALVFDVRALIGKCGWQMRVPQVAGRELVGDQNWLPNMPYVFLT